MVRTSKSYHADPLMRSSIIIYVGSRNRHYRSDLSRYHGLLGFIAWRDVMAVHDANGLRCERTDLDRETINERLWAELLALVPSAAKP
ncbi:MAG: hypothetical protein KF797_11335 [Flavobacteriales bacterium]|nr:hypothetical protein [Flavobacteriales bacterium]